MSVMERNCVAVTRRNVRQIFHIEQKKKSVERWNEQDAPTNICIKYKTIPNC